jgi:hypothetical protein
MQEKDRHISSILEALRNNPNYARPLDLEGRRALMFLDLTNILCQAAEFCLWIDLEDLVLIFSRLFDLQAHYAFTGCGITSGMVNFLYNTGYIVRQSPFDSDAIMGYTICESTGRHDAEVVLIGTHDGGFRGVGDELRQRGIDVAFLGFREMFSSYLRSGPLFCFEDMKILSPLREARKGGRTEESTELNVKARADQVAPDPGSP